MQEIKKDKTIKYGGMVLLILSVAAAISKILVGFDIDEGYALSLPYRLLEGDKMFLEMWEIHQTSAIFAAALMKPFLAVTGQTTGLVLYVRIVCTFIHFILSVCMYKTLLLRIKKETAFLLSLIYFNFLPKWMMSVDFSIQFTWFFAICILCFIRAEAACESQKYKKVYGFMSLCGISLAFLVLGYPTMLVLYPVFVLLILCRKRDKKIRRNMVLCLTGSCVVLAALFLAYILSYMSLQELLNTIPNVFSDGSHQFDADAKWSLWAGHVKDLVLQTIITLVPAVVLTLAALWLEQKKSSKAAGEESGNRFRLMLFGIYTAITSLIVIGANVIHVSWGPFRLQIRYIIMFVLGFVLLKSLKDKEKAKWVRDIVLVPVLAAFLAILLASNVGPVSSSSYLVAGVMAACFVFVTSVSEMNGIHNKNSGGVLLFFTKTAMLLFVISLIMCKGYYVRVSEYPPSNILEKRVQITKGPAKGIFVYPDEYDEITETYDNMVAYTDEEDLVLYLGTQTLSNLYTKGRAVIPTTISTPAFNEQWIHYFELHKEKMPTVIFLSKSTVDNQEKFFEQNVFGMWIAKHYDVKNRIDTKYLCIIR